MTLPLTVAEQSDWTQTSRHCDVLAYIEALHRVRPVFRVETMGRSALGQDMPVLIFGERPGKPVILVLANIHAGEVEGKEALLMLARDLPERIFEELTLIFVPDYNPDGNDRIDVKNRKLDLAKLDGQIGPDGGVGTRYTGQGINLNRDYMKQEARESRNLSRLMRKWSPDLTVDCHTTDGSIHGFALTFDTGHIPNGPCEYVRRRMLPVVRERLDRRTGLKTFFYGNFLDEKNPSRGWATYSHLPRYGSHYRGLTGRMDILLESYSYIPFKERAVVTTEILKEIFQYAVEHGAEMQRLVREGQAARPDPVGIAYPAPVQDGECEILAWDLESQLARKIPGREMKAWRMPHYCKFTPSKSVSRPAAYLVPREFPGVIDLLQAHGLSMEWAEAASERLGERYLITARGTLPSPDVGDMQRLETVVTAKSVPGPVSIRPGDVIVPTDQPLGTLAVYLLEPESDDGLVRWNFLDDDLIPGGPHPIARLHP